MLQLFGTKLGQRRVEVLASGAERLPPEPHFFAQAVAMARLEAVDAIVVKFVAIRCDRIHQRLQRHVAGISRRAPAADAAAHQNRSCQDRRRLFDQFFGDLLRSCILGHTGQQRVERHLANHESIVVAVQVDMVRIPLAKNVIRPAVNRMIKVVSSRIARQFRHPIRIEGSGS